MKPRHMTAVIGGKRYRTETATLLASGSHRGGARGQPRNKPEPIVEVRIGGVELGAVAFGGDWGPLTRDAFLLRTPKGSYFAQYQSSWPGGRDELVPLEQSEAIALYDELPNKEASFETAFPGVEVEDA
jgi:hypothetical protein